ncbi:MAG TPA: ABC transporter permease [Ktedonobacteraceae bacterium]|nr:ABC transporter permease [Ktedonobacteraceae bacterium]
MGRYLVRRLLQAIPLLFLLSLFMFLLIHALPGGPDQVILTPNLDAAGRAALRAKFGLDQPLPIQYLKWLGNTLTGDFGISFFTNQPVAQILGQRFPATLELFLSALIVALVFAILLGVISAVRQNSVTDYFLTSLSYFGLAMPAFLLGLFAQDIFGVKLHWLPTSGTATLGVTYDLFNGLWDHLLHLLLPMLVLATLFIAGWSRYMRSSMIEVIKQDYMRTARAKGVSPRAVLIRHALRNAIIPLITVVAIDFGAIAGGAVITEGIFAWPGMGQLFINSLNSRDFPVLLAMLVLSGTLVILFNLVADILYAVMDPRIRYT